MNYDQWLEQPYQDAEDEAYAIDSISEQLFKEDCSPFDVDNFIFAVDEGCLNDVIDKLKEAVKKGDDDPELLGKIVWHAVREYWATEADKQAEEIYKRGDRL